jgi:hypothetical protein
MMRVCERSQLCQRALLHCIAKASQLSSLSNRACHPAVRWAGRVEVQLVGSCRLLELEAKVFA